MILYNYKKKENQQPVYRCSECPLFSSFQGKQNISAYFFPIIQHYLKVWLAISLKRYFCTTFSKPPEYSSVVSACITSRFPRTCWGAGSNLAGPGTCPGRHPPCSLRTHPALLHTSVWGTCNSHDFRNPSSLHWLLLLMWSSALCILYFRFSSTYWVTLRKSLSLSMSHIFQLHNYDTPNSQGYCED